MPAIEHKGESPSMHVSECFCTTRLVFSQEANGFFQIEGFLNAVENESRAVPNEVAGKLPASFLRQVVRAGSHIMPRLYKACSLLSNP